jgi:hypothetical protein
VYGKKESLSKTLDIGGFNFILYYVDYFPSIASIYATSSILLSDNVGKFLNFSIPISFCLLNESSIAGINENKTFKNSSSLIVSLKFRKCLRGENYELDTAQCIPCKPSFFSKSNDYLKPSSCFSCIDESYNCYGGDKLTPKAGFWRNGEFSFNFIPCPYKNGKKIYFKKEIFIYLFLLLSKIYFLKK